MENNVRIYVQTAAFLHKKQLPKGSCKIKTMLKCMASASGGQFLPADKARFSPQYLMYYPFKA